jgi:hypothetical protein
MLVGEVALIGIRSGFIWLGAFFSGAYIFWSGSDFANNNDGK